MRCEDYTLFDNGLLVGMTHADKCSSYLLCLTFHEILRIRKAERGMSALHFILWPAIRHSYEMVDLFFGALDAGEREHVRRSGGARRSWSLVVAITEATERYQVGGVVRLFVAPKQGRCRPLGRGASDAKLTQRSCQGSISYRFRCMLCRPKWRVAGSRRTIAVRRAVHASGRTCASSTARSSSW